MDGSLASMFMDGSLPTLPISWTTVGESTEELQLELARTSMELESAKSEALAQEKLQEARMWRLQELLNTARMERDSARQECQKLQDRLRHASSISPADSPCSFFHSISSSPSSGVPSSPDPLSDMQSWSLHEIQSESPQLSLPPPVSDGGEIQHSALAPFPLSQVTEAEDIHTLLNLDSHKEHMTTGESTQFSMDVLEEDLLLDQDQSIDLSKLEESFPSVVEAKSSTSFRTGRTLSRQSSSNSSSASVPQHLHSLEMSQEVSAPVSSQIPSECSPPEATNAVTSVTFQPNFLPAPVAPLVQIVDSSPRSVFPLKRVHLPEPPEADPQVMLGSLPEKGKLLQAVMHAGPLLQTLLLAGPLPQWRHPPPALNTMEIPKVSMASNSLLFPFVTPPPPIYLSSQAQVLASGYSVSPSVSLVPGPIYVRGGTAVRSESALTENRSSLCSRSRKLRKLSPPVLYGDQVMSGPVKLAAGVANFTTAW